MRLIAFIHTKCEKACTGIKRFALLKGSIVARPVAAEPLHEQVGAEFDPVSEEHVAQLDTWRAGLATTCFSCSPMALAGALRGWFIVHFDARISVLLCSCSVVQASLGLEVVVVPGEQAQRRRPTAVQSHDDFAPVFVMFHLQEVLIGRPGRRASEASKTNSGEGERANRSDHGHVCWEECLHPSPRPQI